MVNVDAYICVVICTVRTRSECIEGNFGVIAGVIAGMACGVERRRGGG